MNLRKVFASVGVVVGTAFVCAPAPAQAANMVLGVPTFSNNIPVGTGIGSPKANFPYQTTSFTPSKDLKVKFSVLTPDGLGSRGRGTSSFGYFTNEGGKSAFTSIFAESQPYDNGSDAKNNDWLGTCGQAIGNPCEVTVTFAAGKTYQLGLLAKGISTYGVAKFDQFTFDTSSDQYYKNGTVPGHNKPFTTVSEKGAVFFGMEDGEYQKSGDDYYYDYQDWVVKAQVPEPTTLVGLGIVAGSLLIAGRRKTNQSA